MLAHILFCVTISIRVVLVFKTSACMRRNEEFSLCGWKCPPTCINLRMLAKSERLCHLRWECRVGCRCSAGFVRDEYSKDCVYIHNCPTVSSSAPIAEDEEQESGYTNMDSSQIDYLRGKRLNNNVYTITPCAAAAAAAANTPIARSPEMPYANFAPPEARYYVPSAYYDYSSSGYAGNMHRVEDPYSDTREMLRYSDTNFMEQVPTGRFAYSAPSSYVPINTPHIIGNLNGQYNMQTGSSASSYGIFPSGGVGNCNLPLLFSCSPSVVTGHMMKPGSQVYGYPTSYSSSADNQVYRDGYGGADGHYSQRIHANKEQAMYENSAPVKATATLSNEKST